MADKPLIDTSDLARWRTACEAAPKRATRAMRMAINDAGDRARTPVIRTLAAQMGITQATVRKGLTTKPATREPVYELKSTGGSLSLRSFAATQRKKGVSARPWGKRRIFRGTFIVRSLGGQVFKRVPGLKSRGGMVTSALGLGGGIDALGGIGSGVGGVTQRSSHLEKLWGPAMPKELVKDAVPPAFEREVRTRLPERLAHHMARLFPDIGER